VLHKKLNNLCIRKSLIIKPIKMKQVTFFFIAIFSMCIIFSSCKKSSDPAPTDPGYVGFWKGKYGSGTTAYPTNGYSFLFRSNGTVRIFDGSEQS